MNISTLFQPVGGVALSGVPPRRFPPFLTVWDGQAEREAAFLNIKLHAARFRVCVGLLADRRITAAVCKQTLFQGGVTSFLEGARSLYPYCKLPFPHSMSEIRDLDTPDNNDNFSCV